MKKTPRTKLLTDHLAALGEGVRLRLLRLLEREELSVGELSRIVQLPQSTVSRQLKLLADDGWLVSRAEGTSTLYRLVLDDLASEARALWVVVRGQMEDGLEVAEDTRRLGFILAERRTDTQSFFGRVAGEWDAVRNDLFGGGFTVRSLLTLLPREWTVADLGCGTGNASELLAPHVKRVIAVDQSGPMLEAAKKRLEGVKNVTFVQSPLDRLPIEAASVDAAVCVLVLHHIEEPARALADMRRIIRPGGTVLIVDMIEHDRTTYRHTMGHRWLGFSESGVTNLLKDAGFVDIAFQVVPVESETKGPGVFATTAKVPSKPR